MDASENKFFSLFIPAPIIWGLDQELGNPEPLLVCKTLHLGLTAWLTSVEGLVVHPALYCLEKHLIFLLPEQKYSQPIWSGDYICVINLF